MLGEKREHTALSHQVTDQGSRVEKLPVGALHTQHAEIIPYLYKHVQKAHRLIQ
jgi:hypothetical protein